MSWTILTLCLTLQSLVSAQTDPNCPAGWVHHDQSCYLVHSQKSNWYESQLVCEGHKANLAHVTDEAENIFIKGIISSQFKTDREAHVWLGAADDVIEGQFLWYGTDEPLTYTNWGPGEPNSIPLNINEDCLVYWGHYTWEWADLDCHSQCYSVCEKSINAIPDVIG
ncbi:IgE binding [Mactra antiquata]